MARANQPDSIGTVLKDILRRLKHVETAPMLHRASIKDGALRILDPDDEQRAKFGRLDGDFDGDGDPDWGLAVFDAAGDWALLGTKAGVFVRGAIQGGTIDIGGSDATSFHVDANGNVWAGAADFASAPFTIAADGELTALGAAITGAITGSTITGGVFRSAASGRRVEINSTTFVSRIALFSGNGAETNNGYLSVLSDGTTQWHAPNLGSIGPSISLNPDDSIDVNASDVRVGGDTSVFGSVQANDYKLGTGQKLLEGGLVVDTTNGAGDITIPHGIGDIPRSVSLTIDSPSSDFEGALAHVHVQNVDDTNITARLWHSDSAGVYVGNTFGIWWTAIG